LRKKGTPKKDPRKKTGQLKPIFIDFDFPVAGSTRMMLSLTARHPAGSRIRPVSERERPQGDNVDERNEKHDGPPLVESRLLQDFPDWDANREKCKHDRPMPNA